MTFKKMEITYLILGGRRISKQLRNHSKALTAEPNVQRNTSLNKRIAKNNTKNHMTKWKTAV